MVRNLLLFPLIMVVLLVAGCQTDNETPVPTEASVEQFATANFMTANAPPVGYDVVSFDQIDQNMDDVVYAIYDIEITFDGFYSESRQSVQSKMNVRVWKDRRNSRRQVNITFSGGDVFQGAGGNLNAVRINNSYYMINPNGVCRTGEEEVSDIANLTAGQLIGGVQEAYTNWKRAEINGQPSWGYGFPVEKLNPPAVQILNPGEGVIDPVSGELWVHFNENYSLVTRFTVEMNVHRTVLLFGDQEVTGQVRYEYNVSGLEEPINISVPNGC